MKAGTDKLVTLVAPSESISEAVKRMAAGEAAFPGLAVVVDDDAKVIGVVNNGDIMRLIAADYDFNKPVSSVMISDPIVVPPELSSDETIAEVHRLVRENPRLSRESVAYVLEVDAAGNLSSVIDFRQLVAQHSRRSRRVAVYGLGFVGLTLSVVLASRGHRVTGVDTNESLVTDLSNNRVRVFEPGLQDMIMSCQDRETIKFTSSIADEHHGVFVIAVGTPVDDEGNANLEALESVAREIGGNLSYGDLVLLRSTVPVGSSRNFVKPILEELSGLVAGRDFHLAFTPERTIEGQAIRELLSLPQIIGGLTPGCAQKAASFWSMLTHSEVHVDGLEAAELVKLANNSFRDLSFAFSNSLALLADQYNISAAELISAANDGYPRNPIPFPSPGVGGYCLTKDPYLYSSTRPGLVHSSLSRTGREANRQAGLYPVDVLMRWMRRHGIDEKGHQVLIIGLAFKGQPETNDLRGSTSIEVAKDLMGRGLEVWGWDAVCNRDSIAELGIQPVDVIDAMRNVDTVLILNNHPKNVPPGALHNLRKPGFVFDGWSLLDRRQIEHNTGLTYATMGYMTPES